MKGTRINTLLCGFAWPPFRSFCAVGAVDWQTRRNVDHGARWWMLDIFHPSLCCGFSHPSIDTYRILLVPSLVSFLHHNIYLPYLVTARNAVVEFVNSRSIHPVMSSESAEAPSATPPSQQEGAAPPEQQPQQEQRQQGRGRGKRNQVGRGPGRGGRGRSGGRGGQQQGRASGGPTTISATSGVPFGHVPGYLPGSSSLVEELDKTVLIVLRDGRHLVGILRSFDQFSNMVLEETSERKMHRDSEGVTYFADVPLGVYVVRGDSMVLLGQASSDQGLKQVELGELEEIIKKSRREELQWDFDKDLLA